MVTGYGNCSPKYMAVTMLPISILVSVGEAVPDSLLAHFLVFCILKSGSATYTTGGSVRNTRGMFHSCGKTPVYL